jgi:hypothetical protein
MTRVEPRPGSTETAPAALREKLIPMRDTPDRQLQLDFQRRAPEFAPIAPTLRSERAPHFTTLGSLRPPGPGSRIGVFFRFEPKLRLPLMPRTRYPGDRVNDAGLKCELRTPSFEERRRVTAAGLHHTTACPLDRAVSHNQRRARTSTTTLTDFCNRRKARAHWRTITTRRSAAFQDEALRLAALRRCETAPTVQSRVSAVLGTEAGSGC